MNQPPSTSFEATVDGFPTGLTGVLGVRIRDNAGADTQARTTAGIAEDVGFYRTTLVSPAAQGQYTIVWDSGGATPVFATEELVVTYTAIPAVTGPGYAALSDVQARAGALGNAWTLTSKPSTTDITQFISDVRAEIDGYLGGRGLASPALGTPAANALRNVNALGALLLALEATYPEGAGLASADTEISTARDLYDKAIAAIIAGTHPAIWLLQEGNVASRATTFWEQEPNYGLYPLDPRGAFTGPDWNPYIAPAFVRGQSL